MTTRERTRHYYVQSALRLYQITTTIAKNNNKSIYSLLHVNARSNKACLFGGLRIIRTSLFCCMSSNLFFGKSFAFNLLLYYAHCSITFLQKKVFCSRSPNSMETFFFVDIGRYVFCVHVQHTHAFIQVEWSFFKKSNSQDYFYISCLQFTIFNEFFFSFRCRHSCYAAFQKTVIKREREK